MTAASESRELYSIMRSTEFMLTSISALIRTIQFIRPAHVDSIVTRSHGCYNLFCSPVRGVFPSSLSMWQLLLLKQACHPLHGCKPSRADTCNGTLGAFQDGIKRSFTCQVEGTGECKACEACISREDGHDSRCHEHDADAEQLQPDRQPPVDLDRFNLDI